MEAFTLIIFGISGNLAQLKIIPALYDLEEKGLLPEGTKIVGMARKTWSKEEFEKYIRDVIAMENRYHKHDKKAGVVNALLNRMSYLPGDFESGQGYVELKEFLGNLGDAGKNHLYYLATYPKYYGLIFNSLKEHGLNTKENGWVRLMIEKPFGHDLKSARELDELLRQYFTEEQIFRLDHYLGKETLQNILVFRFGNGILQPLMNKDYIDHIQITWAEDFGIGKRGGYFDTMGAFRDVGQNHLLQMLVVTTMNAPSEFNNREVTDKRIEILQNLRTEPDKIVFGQYKGYKQEEKVANDSKTDTFFALRTEVELPEWKGVPVYIRAGKMLPQTTTEISVVFKPPKNKLFPVSPLTEGQNVLTYRIQPNEGIGLSLSVKRPGHKLEMDKDYMQFCYWTSKTDLPDPYEKLIYDVIGGDPTFFNDAPEVEAAWDFTDKMIPLEMNPDIYEPGTWGPESANRLIEADGRKWLEPSPMLCSI